MAKHNQDAQSNINPATSWLHSACRARLVRAIYHVYLTQLVTLRMEEASDTQTVSYQRWQCAVTKGMPEIVGMLIGPHERR